MSVYYSKEHEWVRVEGDIATVGITDFAQGQLGDVVFVEVPEAGRQLSQGGDGIRLEIGDDGVGFDPTGDFPGHLGLRSMRERAARIGAVLELESAPGQGTRTCILVPPAS